MPPMEPEDVPGGSSADPEEYDNILVVLDFSGLVGLQELVFGNEEEVRGVWEEGMKKMMDAMAQPGGPFHDTFEDDIAAIEEHVVGLSKQQQIEEYFRFPLAIGRSVVIKTGNDHWEEVFNSRDTGLEYPPLPFEFELHRTEGEGSKRDTFKKALGFVDSVLEGEETTETGVRLVGFEENETRAWSSRGGDYILGKDGLWRVVLGTV